MKGKEESQHKHCPGKSFRHQTEQLCHDKQGETNTVDRWAGAAGAAQLGIRQRPLTLAPDRTRFDF